MVTTTHAASDTQRTMAMVSAALAHDPAGVRAELSKNPAALNAALATDAGTLEAVGATLLEAENKKLAKFAKDWLESAAAEYEAPVLDAPALREPKRNTTDGDLTEIMAKIALLMSVAAEETMLTRREINRSIEASRAEALQQKSEDFEAQQIKNQQMQQALGCIGKIIGGLVTALSVIGAVFTGGASLAVAAVGIALMAADKISVAVTGVSFVEKALSPIVEHVLKPIVAALSELFSSVLTALGVDPATAEIVGKALAAVMAVVMIIAAMVAVRVGLDKLPIGKLLGSVAKRVGELAPKAVSNAMSRAGGAASRVVDRIGTATVGAQNTQKAGLAVEQVVTGMRAAHAGIAGGAQIGDGISAKAQADILAAMTVLMSELQIVQDMMKALVSAFSDSMKAATELITDISRIAESELNAGRAILNSPVRA